MKPSYQSTRQIRFHRAMIGLLTILAFGIGMAFGTKSHAETVTTSASVRFNNDNLATSHQPAPIMPAYDFGDMTITPLEDGKTLITHQYILAPEYGVNIWRYELDDAWWFVTNKGVIYGENSVGLTPMASTSLQALSIYLTL